ncbi:MAG TPA: carbamoyltransferase C-terminal domain-containing protein [Bryobacteraceae bacterium]|nr:carbamoyltransferase C-terminal domain-containing protein [Bryobacteraceae bacterium]
MAPKVLIGLGGLLSDPSCCVIKNGRIASAVEQAKVSRQDRPGTFPAEAFALALEVAGVRESEIDGVALARPFSVGPESDAQLELRARFPRSEIVVVEHHHAHAASAYYASGFDSASVLSVDRAGDFRSAVLFRGEKTQLTPVRELYFPDSLGDLFNRVTEMLGYEPRADEHKVQWMSASGKAAYLDVFRKILHAENKTKQTWPKLERGYFDADRLTQGGFSARFYDETGIPAKEPLSQETKADLACSLQTAIEETVSAMATADGNFCIAGGLALNALLVQALELRFQNVFVQPVAGNAGTSLGAALHAWHNFYGQTARAPFETLCLGPAYDAAQVKGVLENCKLRFHLLATEGELIAQAIETLSDNKIVAWMQGRMEFGPRALGNRSILASPLNPYSTENLNVYIKHRESHRKFAASVPEEYAQEYFEVGSNARYLATVGTVRPKHRKVFSAALLSGDLIRVHTVSKEENPLYHALLTAAGKATGLPVLYNTSFNLFGDPLVCTPRDAVRSFYSSGIDALFAGSFYLEK